MAPEPTPAPYKVYTALVTQSGGDDSLGLFGDGDGDLTNAAQGTTVLITVNPNNTDYSFIGAPNSNEGTSFVLTQDISYTDLDVDTIFDINLGAPTVTVLENTIGDIWFTYGDVGTYFIYSNDDSFYAVDKLYLSIIPLVNFDPGANIPACSFTQQDIHQLQITTADGGDFGDSRLSSTPIEIRIYN
jgi:hypothetical protein